MYYTYNSSVRGKPGGKRFLLLDSLCWPALKLAENPCTAPPSSPLPRLFNHKRSHWLTRNSGTEWPRTEVCYSARSGQRHKNVRHRGGGPPAAAAAPTFQRSHFLFVYFHVPLLSSDQTSGRPRFLLFKTCFRERRPLWELPLLHSRPKQEISVLTCFAFCCAEKKGGIRWKKNQKKKKISMYIFGNLILQGLKDYNTWRKTNANKKNQLWGCVWLIPDKMTKTSSISFTCSITSPYSEQVEKQLI